jgi:hypothetical protein
MAWNDSPPTADELKSISGSRWDASPPTPDELKAVGATLKKESSWQDIPLPGGTAGGYARGALKTLPTAGMLVGGALGLGGGPVGAVAGAGAGAALGKSAENLGEGLLGDNVSRSDLYAGPALEGIRGAGGEAGGQLAGKALGAAAQLPVVQKTMSGIRNAAGKVGELLSGVPQKEIETYAKNADAVKDMAKASDSDTYEASKAVREKINSDIQATKDQLNTQISSALKGSDKQIPVQPIIDSLEKGKAGINPKLYPEQIDQISELQSKVASLAKDGNISADEAHQVKQFLQSKADSAYQKTGQVFSLGSESAKVAKSGAATARSLVNEAEPAVASANNQLSELHDIEESMNSNMLRNDKSEAPLLGAGSGGNPRNADALERLGKFTGTDVAGEADKLAAMRTFGSPKLMAQGTTGKVVGHAIAGAGLGYLIDGQKGAVIGGLFSSPAALKVAIDSGLITKEALSNPGVMSMISKAAQNWGGSKLSDMSKQDNAMPATSPKLAAPTKGPDKWASDGHDNLIEHADEDKDTADMLTKSKADMMKDPKTKDMLIRASDLKPGSKAMDKLMNQLKNRASKGSE